MNELPKISVQIPTYNQARFIPVAVNSVLKQQYRHIEVVIADDNSSDDTEKIMRSYGGDDRVKYFKNPQNLGRIGNYQKSLYQYCTGDWVINLDGDDYFNDDRFIADAVKLVTENSQDNVLVFQANHNLQKVKNIFSNHKILNEDAVLINGPDYFINFYKVQRFRHCATMYNRSKALPLNFYSFDCLFTDFNSVAKLLLTGKIIISGKPVAQWREHAGNESGGLNEKNITKEIKSIEDLAAFAKPYFTEMELQHWEKKMKAYMVTTYIELLTKRPVTLKSFKYIISKLSWNSIYFRQLFKFLFIKP